MTKNKNRTEPKYVRARLPADRHEAFRHLGLELGLSIDEMLNESIVLLLRFHGRQGLPDPLPPREAVPR